MIGGNAFASVDVALRAAGEEGVGAVGKIALSYQNSQAPGTVAAQLRAEIAAGTLTNSGLKSAGIGSHTDRTA